VRLYIAMKCLCKERGSFERNNYLPIILNQRGDI
jgi:hypothetical protein